MPNQLKLTSVANDELENGTTKFNDENAAAISTETADDRDEYVDEFGTAWLFRCCLRA